MRVRTLLIVTAILSSILGAVIGYMILTVPNDLQATDRSSITGRRIRRTCQPNSV